MIQDLRAAISQTKEPKDYQEGEAPVLRVVREVPNVSAIISNKETVLLTGSTGFLGSNLLSVLQDKYKFVKVFREDSSDLCAGDSLRVTFANLLDINTVAYLKRMGVTKILHLAGVTSSNYKKNSNDFESNIVMTRKLVALGQRIGVDGFIFISSNAVNYTESSYAKSKKAAELVLTGSHLNYTILRPVIIIGNKSPDLCYFRKLFYRIPFIPLINDGKQLLQPVSIDDMVLYIDYFLSCKKQLNRVFNVAGGQVITQKHFIKTLIERWNIKKPFLTIPTVVLHCIKVLVPKAHILQTLKTLENDLVVDTTDIANLTGHKPMLYEEYIKNMII